MSRTPDNLDPDEPDRPKPRPGSDPKRKPPRAAPESGAGESTFRPNPAPTARGSGSGSGSRSSPTRGGRSASSGDRPREVVEPGPKWYERILFGQVSSGQLAQFCRQFASYLNAGVDYQRSLSSLGQQFQRTALGPPIDRIRMRIKTGSTLEEAMAGEKRIFGPMFLSMIRVAEARGGVPETLKMLGREFEARQRLIRQARSAMIYPVIVLVLTGGVIALLTIFVLPMLASLLADISRNASLPWASRGLLAFSRFISAGGWWLFPLLLIGVPLALLRAYRTPAGKEVMDRIILRIPVLGKLCRTLDTSRFARTLGTLLDAGVDVGSSVDLTGRALAMNPMRNAVLAAREKVIRGEELSVALAPSRQFNHEVLAVLESGEETGKIPESLEHLANEYEERAAMMVKNMGQLIQPLLILILGGLVLFVILAVLLPYIQVITSLAGG